MCVYSVQCIQKASIMLLIKILSQKPNKQSAPKFCRIQYFATMKILEFI